MILCKCLYTLFLQDLRFYPGRLPAITKCCLNIQFICVNNSEVFRYPKICVLKKGAAYLLQLLYYIDNASKRRICTRSHAQWLHRQLSHTSGKPMSIIFDVDH